MTTLTAPIRTTEPTRATERIVGTLFLAAMLTYGPGSGLVASVLDVPDHLTNIAANTMTFTVGAALMLLNSVVVVCIGVLLFPFLAQHSTKVAVGYYASRVIEAVLLALGVISLLLLVPMSEGYVTAGAPEASDLQTLSTLATTANDLSYQVAMTALGIGSLFFCWLLYRSRLVPRFLAIWGFAGYAVFAAGAVLEILGFGVGLLLAIPGGLFEVFFGVWLIVKGFDRPASAGGFSRDV